MKNKLTQEQKEKLEVAKEARNKAIKGYKTIYKDGQNRNPKFQH